MNNWEPRFWAKVDKRSDSECWVWTGARTSAGYSQLRVDGKSLYAHRLSYELHHGQIPEGLTIDHLCRNTACVNPQHLEAVTQRTNTLRGTSPAANATRTGLCKHGHSLEDAHRHPDTGLIIRCRTCARDARLTQTPEAANLRAGLCKRGHSRDEAYRRNGTGEIVYCRACRQERRVKVAA